MLKVVSQENGSLVLEAGDMDGTALLGRALGAALAAGDVVGLVGDLGAGKTALVREIASGAGVPEGTPVNSPTFTILNIYSGAEVRLVHLDLYRLGTPGELEGIGLADLLDERSALVVEWFDRFPDAFASDYLRIDIEVTGETSRRFAIAATGSGGRELLEEVAVGVNKAIRQSGNGGRR